MQNVLMVSGQRGCTLISSHCNHGYSSAYYNSFRKVSREVRSGETTETERYQEFR